MIVYTETNFVLELAFVQEESESCEHILRLAEHGHVRLVLPAFSYLEPYATLSMRKAQRNRVRPELGSVLRELGRTAPYASRIAVLERTLVALIEESSKEELRRLIETRRRVSAVAEVVPMDAAVVAAATEIERDYSLSAQDAVVFASVRAHLERERPRSSCFLNRNARDFNVPYVNAELRRFRCKMLTHFDQGYGYIVSTPDR